MATKQHTKPIIILFNGFASSKIFWQYNYVGTSTLQKNNFLLNLKKIGNVFTFNLNFFNINYFSIPDKKEEQIKWKKIYQKYKPHTTNITFNLEDLDYKNICRNVYNQVKQKFGNNRKYILIGHSYGSGLALLFAKMYKNECLFAAVIDNPPYLLEFYEKYDDRKDKKIVDKTFKNNADLQNILNKIKNGYANEININKEIDLVYELIEYESSQDRIKYYNNKLAIPTLFFRAFSSNPITKFQKEWNKFSVLEKEKLAKYNKSDMFKYIIMLDAEHFIWKNQNYSDMIQDEIRCMMNKFY